MIAPGLIALALHAALMLSAALLLTWGRPTLAARLAGHDAPPPPWRDLRKLWRKADPRSSLAPAAVAALVLVAMLIVPSFTLGMTSAQLADLPTVFLLLAASRVIELLGAVAEGGPIVGPAVARAVAAWTAGLPALTIGALVVGGAGASANLDSALAALAEQGAPSLLPPLLVAVSIVLFALLEEGTALPDVLGGPSLALSRVAMMLRTVVWLGLAAVIAGPAPATEPAGWAVSAMIWLGKFSFLTVVLAAWDARGQPSPALIAPALIALLAALLALGFGSA